jgi:hypothetical protein
MGPWHRTIVGVACGMLITAVATRYSNSSGWLIVGAIVLLVAVVVHGLAWPRWQLWRAGRREPGYLRIVGGYRTNFRLVIRYKNGRQEATVFPPTAQVTATAYGAATVAGTAYGTVGATGPAQPTSWKDWREWWRLRPGRA